MRLLGRRVHPVAVAIGAIVAFNLTLAGFERLAGAPSGPRSSSFATAPEGVAAYAELLERAGHEVVRRRAAPSEARLDPGVTVVVLDPAEIAPADTAALGEFVSAGGRLVAGGRDPGWLGAVVESPPAWEPGGVTAARPLAPVPELGGAALVRAGGEGSWEQPGAGLPFLGSGDETIGVVATTGAGRVVMLADPTVLHNELLDEAGNAALGLGVAGSPDRPVLFLESVHGYGLATGLRALPLEWRAALVYLLGAALVLMWARGRRLGPPEPGERSLGPARRDYAEALGGALERTRDPTGAAAPLRVAALERLARRAGVGSGRAGLGAGPAGVGSGPAEVELRARAEALGLTEGQVRAIFEPGLGEADAVALGRAHAVLQTSPGSARPRSRLHQEEGPR